MWNSYIGSGRKGIQFSSKTTVQEFKIYQFINNTNLFFYFEIDVWTKI